MSRIIFHIDFNSFFASVEQQANPFLRGKAIAVAGKGKGKDDAQFRRSVVTTASREAKQLGVKTAMATWEALAICPNLIIIPGDPRKYSEITHRFVNILRRYSDKVQLFSADEAFFDATDVAVDWMGAVVLAQRIRDDIRRECGSACTVSIGIAPNKLVAKLASESVKPNGLTCVPPSDVSAFVLSRPLGEFCGIGRATERKLEQLGIASVATLRNATLHALTEAFKPSLGSFLYYAARGIGPSEIENDDQPPKSVGHSYTFAHDLLTEDEIRNNLLTLCDRVAIRMRKLGLVATHLSSYARYGDFTSTSVVKRFHEPLSDGLEIFKAAWALIKPELDLEKGVRLLGISASGLLATTMPQTMFRKNERMHQTLTSLDKLTERYGLGVWQRGSTMKTELKERTSGWHYDHEM